MKSDVNYRDCKNMEQYSIAIFTALTCAIGLLLGGFCKLFFSRLTKFEKELSSELKEFRESITNIRVNYVPQTTCAEYRQDGQCRAAMLKVLVDNNAMIGGFAQKYEEFSKQMQKQGDKKVQKMNDLTLQIQKVVEQHSTDTD
jgi:hypothetical protein